MLIQIGYLLRQLGSAKAVGQEIGVTSDSVNRYRRGARKHARADVAAKIDDGRFRRLTVHLPPTYHSACSPPAPPEPATRRCVESSPKDSKRSIFRKAECVPRHSPTSPSTTSITSTSTSEAERTVVRFPEPVSRSTIDVTKADVLSPGRRHRARRAVCWGCWAAQATGGAQGLVPSSTRCAARRWGWCAERGTGRWETWVPQDSRGGADPDELMRSYSGDVRGESVRRRMP